MSDFSALVSRLRDDRDVEKVRTQLKKWQAGSSEALVALDRIQADRLEAAERLENRTAHKLGYVREGKLTEAGFWHLHEMLKGTGYQIVRDPIH